MALIADYTAGTISVAANGTAVTGVGTAWQTAMFQEGDWLIANGWVNIIASVNSNTSLTLAQPWRGGALSGAQYRLRYMSDGSRSSAQARQLIDMLGNSGSLEALAALIGANDRLPYFTGPGVMALTPLTALARTLLTQSTPLNFKNQLELNGFGVQSAEPTDLNAATANGIYRIANAVINTPDGNGPSGSMCLVINWNQDICAQIFFRRSTSTTFRVFFRVQHSAGVWTPWSRVYHALDAFSTVSQSGDVATGGLMETGSNANGYYKRYADGTVECWSKITVARNSATHLIYTWPLPVTMLNDASRVANVTLPYGNADYTNVTQQSIATPTVHHNSSNISCAVWVSTGVTVPTGAEIRNVNIHAKGRWRA